MFTRKNPFEDLPKVSSPDELIQQRDSPVLTPDQQERAQELRDQRAKDVGYKS